MLDSLPLFTTDWQVLLAVSILMLIWGQHHNCHCLVHWPRHSPCIEMLILRQAFRQRIGQTLVFMISLQSSLNFPISPQRVRKLARPHKAPVLGWNPRKFPDSKRIVSRCESSSEEAQMSLMTWALPITDIALWKFLCHSVIFLRANSRRFTEKWLTLTHLLHRVPQVAQLPISCARPKSPHFFSLPIFCVMLF